MDHHRRYRHYYRSRCDKPGRLSCMELADVQDTEMDSRVCICLPTDVSAAVWTSLGKSQMLTKVRSIIVPIAFRLATYDPAGLTLDPTFKEVLFVVWTQVELHFSIISATIPVLRPVANNLNTSYSSLGPIVSSEDYAGSSSGYKLSTLKSASKITGRSTVLHLSNRATWETPDASAGSSAFVNHGPETRNAERRATPETDSIESHSSEQMIIRKQISWRVERGGSESPTEQK
jgi:hypothetical protein